LNFPKKQEYGAEWAQKIKEEKFKYHNAQWLDMVTGGGKFDHRNSADDEEASLTDDSDHFDDLGGEWIENDHLFLGGKIFKRLYHNIVKKKVY